MSGGKTQRKAVESVAARGYWIGRGKRAFMVAKRMQAAGAIPGAAYSFDAFNANANRSQWDNPKIAPAYEVAVSVPGRHA